LFVRSKRELKVVVGSMRHRKTLDLTPSKVRSAITNGSAILAGQDHRGAWMRRLRDLLNAHENDAGGYDSLSEGQRAIIRRAAMLEIQCELLESKFAASDDGAASKADLDLYQRTANSLRRLLESLNLHRGRLQRDVTPRLSDYLASIENEPEEAA
jgi:hypothetical protein